MLVIKVLLPIILLQIIGAQEVKSRYKKKSEMDSTSLKGETDSFSNVPDFDVDYIYATAYSPNAVGTQLLQNFFNWFTTSVFWITFLSFYQRLYPIFFPENARREFESRIFGDVLPINATDVYELTFFPEPVVTQMIQNFFNFFNSSMFWLFSVPFYERFLPIFSPNKTAESRFEEGQAREVDLPNFNVTFIYFTTFSPGDDNI
jgi:hypothetical protein